VKLLKAAKKPLIIAGGGARYSGAEELIASFALEHGIPITETIAGKSTVPHDHPAHAGPIGIVGSTSANALASEADVIIAIGTRLMDFTTGSWTVFNRNAKFISLNAARWDATKHRALGVVGDAKESLEELSAALKGWKVDASWMKKAKELMAEWNAALDGYQKPTNAPVPTYAQVVGVVNKKAAPTDYMITAAGGLPGETMKNWRCKTVNSYDLEFGFSCMGYEIAGGWGAAMADPSRETIVMVGDGSYMMMNSDIYSTVLTGHKLIIIVCDNGGYAVINRLQNFKGTPSFNNLIKDCKVKAPFSVDFVKHAEAMGAAARKVESLTELEQAMDWAKAQDRTAVISIVSDAFTWTPGDALWDVGVPQVSKRKTVNESAAYQADVRKKQRVGV
jgi:3D-(3,5/4)-trihydroxycyclohexane-1,2-dione acylhydrolase (decyclizing)